MARLTRTKTDTNSNNTKKTLYLYHLLALCPTKRKPITLQHTIMDHIRKAFGEDVDLYQVLGLKDRDEAEDPAKLRKAYFRKALVYHPDKTKEKDAEVAKEKFQAISFAYQVLKNPEKRAEYNDTGHVDEEGDDEDNDNGAKKNWKDYFDLIFGKVSTSKIDAFALKYKCSEEEQRDVLSEYKKWKGDLVKMLEYVMLSEPLDAKRWVEDYIKPAIAAGTVPDYDATLKKSLKKLEAKIEKEQKKSKKSKGKSKKENKKPESSDEESEECEAAADDSDATETDEDEEEVIASPVGKNKKKGTAAAKKVSAQKAKPTKAKVSKKKKGGEDDLFAMIQANQAKRAGNVFASLGARYGVDMEEDDDPLGDEEFEKIQSRLNKKKRSR